MEILSYEEDSVFIPSTLKKSKDHRVEFDEEGYIAAVPVEPVANFFNILKKRIELDGFIDIEHCAVTDIITDNDGFIIGMQILPIDLDYTPNLVIGITAIYNSNTYGNVRVTGFNIGESDQVFIYNSNNFNEFHMRGNGSNIYN